MPDPPLGTDVPSSPLLSIPLRIAGCDQYKQQRENCRELEQRDLKSSILLSLDFRKPPPHMFEFCDAVAQTKLKFSN